MSAVHTRSRPCGRAAITAGCLLSLAMCALPRDAIAVPAGASVPPYSPHTLPPFIIVAGHDGAGEADPAGEMQVIVRDDLGNTLPGIPVRFEMSRCTDLWLAAEQPFPGLLVDCDGRGVTAFSDVAGVARFRIVGGTQNPGGAPGASFQCARIWVGGTLLWDEKTVCVYDQNRLDGLNANDLSALLTDYAMKLQVGRSDYDGSGALGANDLSLWMRMYFRGASGARVTQRSTTQRRCERSSPASTRTK